MWAPDCVGSLVVAFGLRYYMSWGILIPRLGVEPLPPCIVRLILNNWTTREVRRLILMITEVKDSLVLQCSVATMKILHAELKYIVVTQF